MIALVDCDAFFVSCERVKDPDLLKKPVCVLSNNDGCVISRSKEAKQLGIKMGEPLFLVKKKYPGVIYISSDMDFYEDISQRVMASLLKYTPTVEQYSIDEAFIDLSGLRSYYHRSFLDICKLIRREIYNDIKIPVSIGLSVTKTLAKLACHKAKDLKDGVYQIGLKNISKEFQKIKVEEIWGIGKNTKDFLNKYGVYFVSEFVSLSDIFLKQNLGKKYLEKKQELLGNCIYNVVTTSSLPKSIQKSCSFAQFTNDKNYIKNCLNFHIHRACKKLRSYNLLTSIVFLMLKTKDFYCIYEKCYLEHQTNWELDISSKVLELFEKIYNKNTIYRSCGVVFTNLTLNSNRQLSLFNFNDKIQKIENLENSIDKLNEKFGKYTIKPGFFRTDIQSKKYLK